MFLAKTKRKSKSMNGIGEIIDISKIFTSIAKKKKKEKRKKKIWNPIQVTILTLHASCLLKTNQESYFLNITVKEQVHFEIKSLKEKQIFVTFQYLFKMLKLLKTILTESISLVANLSFETSAFYALLGLTNVAAICHYFQCHFSKT